MTSEKDFENILHTVEKVTEFTDKSFLRTHQEDSSSAVKMFGLWHNVRPTAIYYIYVPE